MAAWIIHKVESFNTPVVEAMSVRLGFRGWKFAGLASNQFTACSIKLAVKTCSMDSYYSNYKHFSFNSKLLGWTTSVNWLDLYSFNCCYCFGASIGPKVRGYYWTYFLEFVVFNCFNPFVAAEAFFFV